MKEEQVKKALQATKKNYNFGVAVVFENRVVQAYHEDDGTFLVTSGCYSEEGALDLPEFRAMQESGHLQMRVVDMGKGLIKVLCKMSEKQYKDYLSLSDETDWEK